MDEQMYRVTVERVARRRSYVVADGEDAARDEALAAFDEEERGDEEVVECVRLDDRGLDDAVAEWGEDALFDGWSDMPADTVGEWVREYRRRRGTVGTDEYREAVEAEGQARIDG